LTKIQRERSYVKAHDYGYPPKSTDILQEEESILLNEKSKNREQNRMLGGKPHGYWDKATFTTEGKGLGEEGIFFSKRSYDHRRRRPVPKGREKILPKSKKKKTNNKRKSLLR